MRADCDGGRGALTRGGAGELGTHTLGGVNEFDFAATAFVGDFKREPKVVERVLIPRGIVERLFPQLVGLGKIGFKNARLQYGASAFPRGDEVARVRQESQLHEGADGVLGREGCLHAGEGDRARGVFTPIECVDNPGITADEVGDVREACVGLLGEVEARASRPRDFHRLADDVHLGDVAHHGQDFDCQAFPRAGFAEQYGGRGDVEGDIAQGA